jgi:ketosteroid isomerase-like protein
VKYWDEEGCFALPDGALVRGHAELLALYEQRLALRPELKTRAAKVLQAGDVALVTNVWTNRLRSGDIDGVDTFEGTVTLVFRRHADGAWRILLDDTASPPSRTRVRHGYTVWPWKGSTYSEKPSMRSLGSTLTRSPTTSSATRSSRFIASRRS